MKFTRKKTGKFRSYFSYIFILFLLLGLVFFCCISIYYRAVFSKTSPPLLLDNNKNKHTEISFNRSDNALKIVPDSLVFNENKNVAHAPQQQVEVENNMSQQSLLRGKVSSKINEKKIAASPPLLLDNINKKHKTAQHTTAEKECLEIIINTRLQAPKSITVNWTKKNWGSATEAHKISWNKLDCVNVLSLYNPKILSYNDKLPLDTEKSSLTIAEQQDLYEMTKVFFKHLNNAGILFFPSFGTLLGIARNNVALLPWDDDIDFNLHDDGHLVEKISKGLKPLGKSVYTSAGAKTKAAWELPGGWILYYKDWGMPWKVHGPGKGYPNLDMNTFKIVPAHGKTVERFVTDPKQLTNGHLHQFDKPASWFGSMSNTMTVPFSVDVKEPITFRVPDKIVDVIIDDYGKEGLTKCQTSQNHNPFCNRGTTAKETVSCENAMANHLAKMIFPCTLLPARFHGTTLINEPHYKGKH